MNLPSVLSPFKAATILRPRLKPALCGLLLLCVANGIARADWPEFRGQWGDGHVSAPGDTKTIGLPLTWSETSNIKWKTPIHDKGWSAPVILGGQVWVTTASADGHDLYAVCLDEAKGNIIF